jgi:hypothetical protein
MYSHFCSFQGGRGAPKNSKIVVGSFKIDGTTFSQKNTNFSKIPTKKTTKTSKPPKNRPGAPQQKHRENNKKN